MSFPVINKLQGVFVIIKYFFLRNKKKKTFLCLHRIIETRVECLGEGQRLLEH